MPRAEALVVAHTTLLEISCHDSYVHVKAFIVNVNKCLKPFFLEQHIDIVNRVSFKAFGLSVAAYPTSKEMIVVIIICHCSPILTTE